MAFEEAYKMKGRHELINQLRLSDKFEVNKYTVRKAELETYARTLNFTEVGNLIRRYDLNPDIQRVGFTLTISYKKTRATKSYKCAIYRKVGSPRYEEHVVITGSVMEIRDILAGVVQRWKR